MFFCVKVRSMRPNVVSSGIPQPTGRTTQYTVVPNCYNRTNRTGAANNADHRQNDHVHRVIKTRGATLVISQNVDFAVNYLSILPFPCLIVI